MQSAAGTRLVCLMLLGMLPAFQGGRILRAEERSPAAKPVDFNRQVRAILSDKCFACHGPDAAQRQAGLRLDERAAALAAAESGKPAIVPGSLETSELVRRISSGDPDERMPPADFKKSLSAEEVAVLKQWVAEGAKYDTHWSFRPPVRSSLPVTAQSAWSRQQLDHFILAKLESSGLAPSQDADKPTLVRRATLDLTGLPPTLAEVDAFLADDRPDSYERLIDRLQASPNFGERMALDWLDASRFADTHGFHIDSGRDMSRWREYVIEAFNSGLPYDRFTVEQLAGDLMQAAASSEEDLRQKIASGFNRNHMINFEGGAIPQEYLTAYIIDRVNTTSTVFLGLTVACAQCHDHKYDPLSQKEFYQLYAFFNNVPENGLDGSKGNAAPLIKSPTALQRLETQILTSALASAEAELSMPAPAVDAAQGEWEKRALAQIDPWTVAKATNLKSTGGADLRTLEDGSVLASGKNPANETYEIRFETANEGVTGFRLEALPDDSFTNRGPGRSENGNVVLTDVRVAINSVVGQTPPLKLKTAAADFSQATFPIANAIDGDPKTGWAIHPEVGKPHVATFALQKPAPNSISTTRWVVSLDFQSQFGQHQLGRFRLSTTSADDPHSAALPAEIAALLKLASDQRSPEQQAQLQKYYRESVSPELRELRERVTALRTEQANLEKQVASTMVMEERPSLRETTILVRGAYDKPGDKVEANVPAVLGSLPADQPRNRLSLANWLVDPQHPLMARVTVNRYWQMFFGTGIVKTADDFGLQGESPSHPELLDQLAVEFVSAGSSESQRWDIKRLVRQFVTSSTYRQNSAVSKGLQDRDPENRLLARGPRFRLQAELLRDQALFHSGLLDSRIGGKSVSPYQPAGIWEELASRADGANWTAQSYSQDHGVDLYRRTMYTFWKRTAPPPSLMTLDAPDRETCTVRRARTNTPLQALVMMNDPTYVEAARKFAERILRDGGDSLDKRLDFAFRSVMSRSPTEQERTVLRTLHERQSAKFQQQAALAAGLLKVGESPADSRFPPQELATWTVIANVLLNADEAVTKG
jgi:mono/diheme cytochrome c family protein